MKQLFIKFLQWLTILFSWLTLSPLFFLLARFWKLMGKKLSFFLLLISPLFLITYFVAGIYGYISYQDFKREYRFTSHKTITRITGVEHPEFKVIEYTKGGSSFHGDYSDELLIEFKEAPSIRFYNTLDSLAKVKGSNWSKRESSYNFSQMWGNELPAPEGEDNEEDMSFSITIKKGEKQARITYGTW